MYWKTTNEMHLGCKEKEQKDAASVLNFVGWHKNHLYNLKIPLQIYVARKQNKPPVLFTNLENRKLLHVVNIIEGVKL